MDDLDFGRLFGNDTKSYLQIKLQFKSRIDENPYISVFIYMYTFIGMLQ